jgi:hypothetical protein
LDISSCSATFSALRKPWKTWVFLAKTIFESSHLVSPVFNLRRPAGVPAEASMKINVKTIDTIKLPAGVLK